MKIYLDIETIPTQRDDIKEYVASKVTHPATMSKPETIAKWIAESKPEAVEEAISKTGLDGAFGQVVCVGIAIDTDPVKSVESLDEAEVLHGLNAELAQVPVSEWFNTVVIGHNVAEFDVRFLLQRFIVNQIPPHFILRRAASAKPWESDKVYDTMVQFAGAKNRISLDKLCIALGLEGKGDITGADVWPMVQAGRLAEVAAYCRDDVIKTRRIHQKMTFSYMDQADPWAEFAIDQKEAA